MIHSKMSFSFAVVLICFIIMAFGNLFLLDSDFGCVALLFLSPFLGFIGLLFALIGINEPDTFKKWFGLVINSVISLLGILMLASAVSWFN